MVTAGHTGVLNVRSASAKSKAPCHYVTHTVMAESDVHALAKARHAPFAVGVNVVTRRQVEFEFRHSTLALCHVRHAK